MEEKLSVKKLKLADDIRKILYAISLKNWKGIEEIFRQNLNLLNWRAPTTGMGFLHTFILLKQPEPVDILLNLRAEPTTKNRDGVSAMQIALEKGYLDIAAQLSSFLRQDDIDILYFTIAKGDVEHAKCWVAKHSLYSAATPDKWLIALVDAINRNNTKIVELLLPQGLPAINELTPQGVTLLYAAANAGNLRLVQLLLESGADPNVVMGQFKALHIAIKHKKLAIIETLAPVTMPKDAEILLQAAKKGDVDVVRVLLENGFDVATKFNKFSEGNILHVAVAHKNYDLVSFLLEKHVKLINSKDMYGTTSLCMAAEEGDLKMVNILLAANADSSARALQCAAYEGHAVIVQLLLEKKAIATAIIADTGENTLHLAAQKGDNKIIKLLLAHDEKLINVQSRNGATALIMAVEKGHVDTVRLLLDAGANRNLLTMHGYSALFIAISRGHTEIIQLLLANWDFGSTGNALCSSALHLAVICRRPEYLPLLLEKFPDLIDSTDDQGRDVVAITLAQGDVAMLKELKPYKPQMSAASNGLTPLQFAIAMGNAELVDYLLEDADIDEFDLNSAWNLANKRQLRNRAVCEMLWRKMTNEFMALPAAAAVAPSAVSHDVILERLRPVPQESKLATSGGSELDVKLPQLKRADSKAKLAPTVPVPSDFTPALESYKDDAKMLECLRKWQNFSLEITEKRKKIATDLSIHDSQRRRNLHYYSSLSFFREEKEAPVAKMDAKLIAALRNQNYFYMETSPSSKPRFIHVTPSAFDDMPSATWEKIKNKLMNRIRMIDAEADQEGIKYVGEKGYEFRILGRQGGGRLMGSGGWISRRLGVVVGEQEQQIEAEILEFNTFANKHGRPIRAALGQMSRAS